MSPVTVPSSAARAERAERAARLCGQLLSVGFEGTVAPPGLLARIAASEVGGVMLFRPNIVDPPQVASLVASLRAAAPPDAPLLVSIDQEGGLVQRVRAPATVWPPMLAVGDARDLVRTTAVGRAIGEELAALGIGWNFAPVLDVHTNSANPVIGNRAFGTTPEAVTAQALAFWRGLRAAGLVGCGKHFPGHGDTRTDSHLDLPVVAHDLERLRRVELAPFAAAARAGMEALMTAHVLYPALDPERPATLSHRIATELLRDELGFRGVLVSDDLGMKAVADRYSIEELAVLTIEAGVDHLLVREPVARQMAAFEAIVYAAEARSEIRARVAESAARVAALKAACTVPMPAPGAMLASLLGTPAHEALAGSFGPGPASAAAGSLAADS
ncbi:MAG TPA: beta-N-acetylhexosaminidase [Polyangia bacterium]|nr:beta-N-acetylhexosaminidase [Polyangia bacterium]